MVCFLHCKQHNGKGGLQTCFGKLNSFIHSFIHSFNKYLVSTYYVLGTELYAGLLYNGEKNKWVAFIMEPTV